jgi:hypothetical protein
MYRVASLASALLILGGVALAGSAQAGPLTDQRPDGLLQRADWDWFQNHRDNWTHDRDGNRWRDSHDHDRDNWRGWRDQHDGDHGRDWHADRDRHDEWRDSHRDGGWGDHRGGGWWNDRHS